ncbi:hypothetical protein TGAMA5MH_00467 [Trichoderma gamsii]|uniref:Secreted protein n=1 Tax=Trichoderma gamsii TaxID=398673 RepID=A0A2K0TSC2_9HYPO|nr:hypothetical protein TGAMA5MH_00467 [Trichoderma gamsii]
MALANVLHALLSSLGMGSVLDRSNCAKRSDTRSQQKSALSRLHSIVFDFSRGDRRSLEVTISAHSKWAPERFFQLDPRHCIALDMLGG